MSDLLTAFWIAPPGRLGYGVTAFSLQDALEILRSSGCELPDNPSSLRVTPGVRVEDLDQGHVVPNMGPIVVRGVWYPFSQIGV